MIRFRPALNTRLTFTVALTLAAASSPIRAQNFLGSAQAFGVLGASTVTNTNPTTITGDLGVYPGLAITGQSDITLNGAVHAGDAVAQLAQTNASDGSVLLAGLNPALDLSGQDLGGMILTPGVYKFSSSAQLTGTLTLDFLGNSNSIFVFQIGSTLTTASASNVVILNGAAGSGVYFNVGSSATLGTSTTFRGNIIASEAITLNSTAKILCGRAIALNKAVTMDNNVITNNCTESGADYGSYGFSGGSTTTVPEPSTVVLMLAGGMGLFTARKLRKRSVA